MSSWIKKIFQLVLIPIALIAGYSFFAIIFFVGSILLGYAACWLLVETVSDPNIPIVLCDIIFLALLYFVCSSKKFKNGWKEFWAQFKSNI